MRVVPLTDWQKRTLRAVIDLLRRLRLPNEEQTYCPAWKIGVFMNGHGEVRVEWEELVAGQSSRFACYVSPAGTMTWKTRGKEEARWRRSREIAPAEYAG